MTLREFAINTVKKLQDAGYQALWAGGCVRDELLQRTPKDYDIATSALPDQVRQLFGYNRTLPIGAAFGVISVIGPKHLGNIEVATFRKDGMYSDGRHPDSVEVSDAEHDAQRRDFTINGMFFDPIQNRVIDYVGGERDLKQGIVRAIGTPGDRINEDKLRMLRAVRFTATFDFKIDPQTLEAVREHAAQIRLISPERIGQEMVRMLSHRNRALAAELLLESRLLDSILPERWFHQKDFEPEKFRQVIDWLTQLGETDFEPAAFLLLRFSFDRVLGSDSRESSSQPDSTTFRTYQAQLDGLQEAWKLTTQQRDRIGWIGLHWNTLAKADQYSWSVVQPLLIHPSAHLGIQTATAIAGKNRGISFCEERLAWPKEKLDPAWFIRGGDLIHLGLQPGPAFKELIQTIRNEQLDGKINSVAEANDYLKSKMVGGGQQE